MAFPVAAAAMAVPGLLGLFGGKKKKPPKMPSFFVNNPEELQALIRQSTQSQYAGLESSLRENLANAGVLSPSSLSDALTRGSISLGQETLGKFSDLGLQELDRARALQSQDYLMRLEDSLGGDRLAQQQMYEALGGLGQGVGSIIGAGQEEEPTDVLDQILKGTKKKKPRKPYTPDFGEGEEGGVAYG